MIEVCDVVAVPDCKFYITLEGRAVKRRLARLVKAGLLDKRHARRFALVSAWAELLGYCGNVALNALRIAAALEREQAFAQELLRRKKARFAGGFWSFRCSGV